MGYARDSVLLRARFYLYVWSSNHFDDVHIYILALALFIFRRIQQTTSFRQRVEFSTACSKTPIRNPMGLFGLSLFKCGWHWQSHSSECGLSLRRRTENTLLPVGKISAFEIIHIRYLLFMDRLRTDCSFATSFHEGSRGMIIRNDFET